MELDFGPRGTEDRVSTRSDDEKLCPYTGCDELVPATARGCVVHRNLMSTAEAERRRTHPRMLIYRDPRWRAVRKFVKLRDSYTCQRCGVQDFAPRALTVDHMNEGGIMASVDPFNPDELQTLCLKCSGVKDGARGSKGRNLNPTKEDD